MLRHAAPVVRNYARRYRSNAHVAVQYALFPIANGRAGAMVRRMIGRPTSSLFASLLVFFQLLVSPLAHAAPAANRDCGPTGQTTHTTTSGMMDCGDCPDRQGPAQSDSSNGDHDCRTHAACTCPCAHTPALGAIRPFVASPTPPEGAVSDLAASTFDSPLFDFLRPPN